MDGSSKHPVDEEPFCHVVHVLRQVSNGDQAAAAGLLPLVYDQLRSVAQQRLMQERPGHTLQATALVHEAFLKLVGPREIPWAGQAHFYAAAAEAMRRILVDHARSRHREKRGGKRGRVLLNVLDLAHAENSEEILALDEALCRLEQQEPEVIILSTMTSPFVKYLLDMLSDAKARRKTWPCRTGKCLLTCWKVEKLFASGLATLIRRRFGRKRRRGSGNESLASHFDAASIAVKKDRLSGFTSIDTDRAKKFQRIDSTLIRRYVWK